MTILHGSWLLQSESQAETEPGQSGCFFIWGEVWQRVEPIIPLADQPAAHPFCLDQKALMEWGRSLQSTHSIHWPAAGSTKMEWESCLLTVPTHSFTPAKKSKQPKSKQSAQSPPALLPQHSASGTEALPEMPDGEPSPLILCPWEIYGFKLDIGEAIALLNSLPLALTDADDEFLGGDLRFWSHIARWSLDLLTRSKFVPLLDRHTDTTSLTRWHPLLDNATDQVRVEQFAASMPTVCGMYRGKSEDRGTKNEIKSEERGTKNEIKSEDRGTKNEKTDQKVEGNSENSSLLTPHSSFFIAPHALLFHFLHHAIDTQVRQVAKATPLPPTQLPKDMPLRDWLQALGSRRIVESEKEKSDRLAALLNNWLAPIQRQLTAKILPFRTCFILETPESGKTEWTLHYGLQAINDPEFMLTAATVWANPVEQLVVEGRTIDQPQETLLAGLGLASRLYPLIEQSLHESQPTAVMLTAPQVYDFIQSTAWLLQNNSFGVVLPPSLANREGWASRLGLAVRAQTSRNKKQQGLGLQSLLNFKWELTIGKHRLSKEEFERLVALNSPLVEIDGEWVELRSQDIRSAQNFFKQRKDQVSLSLEDAIRISTGDTQTIDKLPVVDFEASGSLKELVNTLTTGNESVEPLPTPDGFKGELRPYQVRGMSWLQFLVQWGLGACLADDMGLGKTVQLIALLLHLKETESLQRPILLVCPTSVLGNWEREAKRFGPDLRVQIHHGSDRPQGSSFAKSTQKLDLIITSYALVQRDIKTLKQVEWQGMVLDEAQNIKNAEAKQSKAVRELNSEFRIALTGTPVENRLAELWSIIDFLNPGYLGPRNFFQKRFAVPIERYGDTTSLQQLRSLVQPFILRRLKTDRSIIQDLPDKQEMTVFCGLSEDQAQLYQTFVDQSMQEIDDAEGIARHGKILALLTRLKQVCNHPLLTDITPKGKVKKTTTDLLEKEPDRFKSVSGKLQRLEEMLEELLAEGDRALIFTQFAEWGKLMQSYLEQQFSREVLFLYGSSTKAKREEMVDRFQNDPKGPRIFILSLKAGGVGLNLTRANHVFHFDRWWNPAVENQATDRAFRIGQTRNVQVHKFVCTGTLEERIHDIIESKKAMAEQVVGTGESWLTEFDTEQLRNLLLLDRKAVMEQEE
ncbi:MAG: DEAD/DEAH box helicase [Leptolyngbyaceae bacterium]|nr:DEAD/DEAH box helicase [Leptolyngbyaceae bacterium]